MDEPITRAEYSADMKRIEAEEHRQNARLEKLEETTEKISDLTASIREMTVSIGAMQTSIKAMTDRLTNLEQEPAENWKKAVWLIIAAVLGAAVGAALRSIGL